MVFQAITFVRLSHRGSDTRSPWVKIALFAQGLHAGHYTEFCLSPQLFNCLEPSIAHIFPPYAPCHNINVMVSCPSDDTGAQGREVATGHTQGDPSGIEGQVGMGPEKEGAAGRIREGVEDHGQLWSRACVRRRRLCNGQAAPERHRRVLRRARERGSSRHVPHLPHNGYTRTLTISEFGAEFFPSDMVEGASGKPFLDFFRTDKAGRPRGVILIELGSEM
jgi:hypothetical protein